MLKLLFAGALGAALAYFLDPDRGKRRRNIARDRLMGMARRTADQVERKVEYAASTAQGISQKISNQNGQDKFDLNDETLAQKVESEIFRDPNIPKGKININAENGVVVLRGELDRPDQINALEDKVRSIPGVAGVENLLHLPNTQAPMS